MRKKLLLAIVSLMLMSVSITIGLLVKKNKESVTKSVKEQQKLISNFSTSNVTMGIVSGEIQMVQESLSSLEAFSLFKGAVVFDSDMDSILSVPENYKVADKVIQKCKKI